MRLKRKILTFFYIAISFILLIGCKSEDEADCSLLQTSSGLETVSVIEPISEDENYQYIHDGCFESYDGRVGFDWNLVSVLILIMFSLA